MKDMLTAGTVIFCVFLTLGTCADSFDKYLAHKERMAEMMQTQRPQFNFGNVGIGTVYPERLK